MTSTDTVQQAFADARRSFLTKVKDEELTRQILATNNIDEIYKTTMKLQEEANGQSRRLMKIRPFLDRLTKYSGVIETLVQMKPEIMALIWGPLKLLLLWSSQMTTALDKLTSTLEELGHALPQMELMGGLYGANDAVKAVLALLFEDILEFYRVNLDFFRKTRWKQLIDCVWDIHLKKLNLIVDSLKQHSCLLREEVTLLDIKEARHHRIRSLDLLDESSKSQRRQKFLSLRDRFSANLYDDRLDWIRNRSVPGCEKWLLEDTAFRHWESHKGSKGSKWLWLQGIPGAGKTYLCGAAIDSLRQHKTIRCLFAFLSYTSSKNQTALTVLQSYLFQAAEDDPDFQDVLLDAKERELRGNTVYVVDMLKSWLRSTGPTYVVIDGLDEMECSERQILLQRLDELSKGCDQLRLLVCSRSEADISRALAEKVTSIQVNERNSGSIQIYIDNRVDDWISKRQFAPQIELELRESLSPLSAKAKGMFLYARIILDSLDERSIAEIRSELQALPNDLDAAYRRIFQRINELPAPRRDIRRKVLGWIGCAPVPMMTFEMGQALDVRPERRHLASSQIIGHDYLVMCGPLIEIVDDKLQFVHFTARDYVFSKEIPDYIDEGDATRELTRALLAYIDSEDLDLDPDVDDDQALGDIMCGKYRLLQYAHFYWPTLLQRLNNICPDSEEVGKLLNHLELRYSNDEFQIMVDSREPPYVNHHYSLCYPSGYNCARRTFQFHLADRRWDWSRNNSGAWVNFDPLKTSKVLVRIQDLYEELINDDDICKKLVIHYGHRLFKCTYLFCSFSRHGFETRQERDTHVRHHERPCKCPVPGCLYFTLGFNTQRRCNEHLAQFHTSKLSVDDISNLNAEDVQPLLFTLILEGDFESTRRLLSSPGGRKLRPEVTASARLIGATHGSVVLTKLLAPPNETCVPLGVVRAAVKSQDVECAEWAIARASMANATQLMRMLLGTKSEEIYRKWEGMIVDYMQNPEPDPNATRQSGRGTSKEWVLTRWIFGTKVFSDIKGNDLKEARLQRTLKSIKAFINENDLGEMLVRVAKTCCNLSLTKQLLSYGAPVNYPRDRMSRDGTLVTGSRQGKTALHEAAKKEDDKDAALLMQHLVFVGAKTYGVSLEEEKGPKTIQRFIGVTWKDLVAQAELKRRESATEV